MSHFAPIEADHGEAIRAVRLAIAERRVELLVLEAEFAHLLVAEGPAAGRRERPTLSLPPDAQGKLF